jgi:Secretion system C-terminal sorting domain
MKKILFTCISILFTHLILSQVNVSAPTSVEVGTNNQFTFTFLPSVDAPSGSSSYKLTSWFINDGNSNMNNTGSGSYGNNGQPFTAYGMGQSQSISIPIKYEENSNVTTSNISITTYVNYYKVVDGSTVSNGSKIHSNNHNVIINRIFAPTITSTPFLKCCTTPVTISASDYGAANVFSWSVSGGSFTGSGANITVTPNLSSNSITAFCTVSRSQNISSYNKSNSKTFNKEDRTSTYTVSTPPVSTYTSSEYLCKGTGRVFSIAPQCGLQSVTWTAPNCSITGQGTTNATITPNSTVTNGSIINIYATVSYTGGCIAQTQTIGFTIFGVGNTTPPLGTLSVNPYPANVTLQNISDWTPSFRMQKGTSINYSNGIFVFNPDVLQVLPQGRTETVQVCYLNVCNGNQSCSNFQVWVPGIANWVPQRMANPSENEFRATEKSISVYPNPTLGAINIKVDKNITGTYQIFDKTGSLEVQQGKINNQNEIEIEMSNHLTAGIYILKISTESEIYTEKIILSK